MNEEKSDAPAKRPRLITVTPYSRQVKKRGSKFWLILGLFYASYIIPLTIKIFTGKYNDYQIFFIGLFFLFLWWYKYLKTHMELEECTANDEGAVAGVPYEAVDEVTESDAPTPQNKQEELNIIEKIGMVVFVSFWLCLLIFVYARSVVYAEKYFEGIVCWTILPFIAILPITGLLDASDGVCAGEGCSPSGGADWGE